MNRKTFLTIALFAIVFIACNQSKSNEASADKIEIETASSPKESQEPIPTGSTNQGEDGAASPSSQIPSKASPNQTSTHIDWDKKIIKNASLNLEVKNFKDYAATVYNTVKQYGGYIASESQHQSEEKIESSITIKVPVDQFENVMNQLPGKDAKVMERKITTDDVTGEIVDVQARLEAKKQIREKYLDFFKQAKNMQEVLQVQTDLNNLQENMEAAAGRISFLNHQSAMSTINLTYYQPLEGFGTNDNPTFLNRLSDAFKTGGTWVGNILIGLISIWPVLLLLLAAYLVFKKSSTNKPKPLNS